MTNPEGHGWRPQASGSGGESLQSLRERYDELRGEYEALLSRIEEAEATARLQRPSTATFRSEVGRLAEAPLLTLKAEYESTADDLLGLARSVDALISRSMKGQHGAAPARDGGTQQHSPPQSAAPGERVRVDVEVRGSSLGELLDFQEQMSKLPGVRRVSMSEVHPDRARLLVELDGEVLG